MAGDAFTAADISVTYALLLSKRVGGIALGAAETAYLARTTGARRLSSAPWIPAPPRGTARRIEAKADKV